MGAAPPIRRDGAQLSVVDSDGRVVGPFDRIVAVTGFRPDLSLLSELRLDLDSSVESPRQLASLIDPNVHSCGTVPPHGAEELHQPEPDFYIVGMKSYGRAPTFLMLTGYEQVRSVVAALTGDVASAKRVELMLPETGVCSAPSTGSSESSCCTVTPAATAAGACCDERAATPAEKACCGPTADPPTAGCAAPTIVTASLAPPVRR